MSGRRGMARGESWLQHLAVCLLVVVLSGTHTTRGENILMRLMKEAFGPNWWSGMCPPANIGVRGANTERASEPCAVTLACWARGGTPKGNKQCGPNWLFSCCQDDEQDIEDNFIHLPPKIPVFKSDPLQGIGPWRRGPQPAVFRRRIDIDYDEENDCGVAGGLGLQKRIIGGRVAQIAEFPWQAHIRIGDYQCGGVLVSRWFVATAGHCVQRARTRDINVWLGALDTRDPIPPTERHRVIKKIVHPLFRFRVTQPDRFDLALLMLSRPAVLGASVLPVCLPTPNTWMDDNIYQHIGKDPHNVLAGMKALVAGWGSTGRGGAPRGTHHLRSAIVPILSTEECILWHKSKHISVEIHSEMFCAGHQDGHQDACLGDSGGPLVVEKDGRYHLVGITSAGFGCGEDHQPGIYHSVLVTAPWIRRLIWS